MTALSLTADLRDWGYHVASAGTAALPPPQTSAVQWTHAWPGWARFLVVLPGGELLLWVGQRPRQLRGTPSVDEDPWETEVYLHGLGLDSFSVHSGHAHSARLDLGDDGEVGLSLDGEAVLALTATGVDFGGAGWAHLEGCAGYQVYQEQIVDFGQWGVVDFQATDLFAASLGVTWGGREQAVEPAASDRHHEFHNAYHWEGHTCTRAGGVWASGDVPALAKRQVVLLNATETPSAAAFARLRCGSEIVLQAAASAHLPALDGRAGFAFDGWFNGQPLEGWLAGLDYASGPYAPDPLAFQSAAPGRPTDLTSGWPLASPLGVPTESRPAAGAPQALVAVRGCPDDAWRSVRESTVAQAVLLAGPVSDDLALLDDPPLVSGDLGDTWEPGLPGLPGDLPSGVAQWAGSSVRLCGAAAWDDGFALGLGTGLELLEPGGGQTTLADAHGSPVLGRDTTGRPWVVLVANGALREWRGALGGRSWELIADQPAGLALASACAATARGGLRLLAGWSADAGQVVAFTSSAPGAAWHGPFPVASVASAVAPYVCARPTGEWEVGWRREGGWSSYRAADPAGDWSLT